MRDSSWLEEGAHLGSRRKRKATSLASSLVDWSRLRWKETRRESRLEISREVGAVVGVEEDGEESRLTCL